MTPQFQTTRFRSSLAQGLALLLAVTAIPTDLRSQSTAPNSHHESEDGLPVVPGLFSLPNSTESDSAFVTIIRPAPGQQFNPGDSVMLDYTINGIAMGVATHNPGRLRMFDDTIGQHVHIVYEAGTDMVSNAAGGPVFLGFASPGRHCVRVYVCRSWHESIKSGGARASVEFVVHGSGDSNQVSESASVCEPVLVIRSTGVRNPASKQDIAMIDLVPFGFEIGAAGFRVQILLGDEVTPIEAWHPLLLVTDSRESVEFRVEATSASGEPLRVVTLVAK